MSERSALGVDADPSASLTMVSGSSSLLTRLMATSVPSLDLSHPNSQDQSPLYSIIPAELRLSIYELVLISYPDPNQPYPFKSHYYRPGYTAVKKTDVALLRACKKAYIEAKDLVWLPSTGNDEEVFWWGMTARRPPIANPPNNSLTPQLGRLARIRIDDFDDYYHPAKTGLLRTRRFKEEHWSKITKVHIFSQMYVCRGPTFKSFFAKAVGLRPKMVKLTIRYTDWWDWETDGPLSLTISPDHRLEYFPESCETLILELETIESKKVELEEKLKIITSGREGLQWRWRRMDGRYLVLDEKVGVKDWEWMGPTTFEEGAPPYPHHPSTEEMKYCVKVLTFNCKD